MNKAFDGLREAVLTEARALAYHLMQDSLKSAKEIAAQSDAGIVAQREAILAKADAEAARERQQIFAEAQASVQRDRLTFRESIIDTVLEAVREQLRQVSSDSASGRALLLALATEGAQAVSGDAVRLPVRPADRGLIDGEFLAELERASGKRAELAPEPLDALGGLVVLRADGRERYDNTLDGRLERQLPEIRAEIWTRLSHAG